ncbi:hypothetical protein GGI07_000862 [Coemansia sp. Benny D115]|nr:hypothetical protein GGI07_000862 [Coemansia sp. Benny D115]
MANARSQFIAIAENAISDRTHELKHLPMSNTSPHTDILQKLIDSKDPVTGMALCGKPLVSEMVGVLIAGTDTTSNTLTWTTMHLMNHPEIYKRLCQDIRREFPDLSKPIRYEEAKTHLPYLTAVILEAMRLTPSVAGFLPRRTPPEGTTIKGHFIPAMNEIGISIAAFHRNPNLWPNPSTFDPERFMGTNMESNIKEILPFSTGKSGVG